ncbi:hypothetical protein ACFVU2_18955 [Leifsonia sp. NPDC058194]|uniref:hypothetical protein n=1 Tax=Leifsonia sp. NPDC058194 TaxID=3346374 RepID=UPI0036DC13C7
MTTQNSEQSWREREAEREAARAATAGWRDLIGEARHRAVVQELAAALGLHIERNEVPQNVLDLLEEYHEQVRNDALNSAAWGSFDGYPL